MIGVATDRRIDSTFVRGEAAVDALPRGLRENREAMAETIENNVRRLIIDETAVNPKYYEKMSKLLNALITPAGNETVELPP